MYPDRTAALFEPNTGARQAYGRWQSGRLVSHICFDLI
jgi:hypothetical protein